MPCSQIDILRLQDVENEQCRGNKPTSKTENRLYRLFLTQNLCRSTLKKYTSRLEPLSHSWPWMDGLVAVCRSSEDAKWLLRRWLMDSINGEIDCRPTFKGCCHKTCQETCQRDEAMDSLSVDSLLPSSKTLRNAEPVCEQIEVNNYFARDVNIAEAAPRRWGWYTIGTMGFLSQEMFKLPLNFTTSLDQSRTWGDLICSRLEAVTLWNEC